MHLLYFLLSCLLSSSTVAGGKLLRGFYEFTTFSSVMEFIGFIPPCNSKGIIRLVS